MKKKLGLVIVLIITLNTNTLILFLDFGAILQDKSAFYDIEGIKYKKTASSYSFTSKSIVYEWNRTWGTTKSDVGCGVALDSTNNILLTGATYGVSSTDILLLKYNSNGVKQWERTWVGTEDEVGLGVAVDSLDNVYLAGQTQSIGAGSSDMLLIKYNSAGEKQWERTSGGTAYEVGRGVAVDSLDNVYLAGGNDAYWSGSDNMHLVKYDSSGVEQWHRTWGGTDWDRGFGVAVDSSDNVYIIGDTESYGEGEDDVILVKYNSSGVEQWHRTWGGTSYDIGYGVAVDSSDCVYIVGSTTSYGSGDYDLLLVKYNSSGIQQWNRTWGGENFEFGVGVTVDSSDNVYLGGSTNSFGLGSYDMVVVKYNNSGVQQWNRTWGGNDSDEGWGIVANSSDNVFIAGNTRSIGEGESDAVLVKYGPDIYKPIININKPFINEKYREIIPDYEISIIEPNLHSLWYTIDNGLNNHTVTQLTGTLNQTAWDASPYGQITLIFYAKDFMGNIGYNEVVIKKVRNIKPTIPGYNMFLIIWVISVVSIIIIKRNHRK